MVINVTGFTTAIHYNITVYNIITKNRSLLSSSLFLYDPLDMTLFNGPSFSSFIDHPFSFTIKPIAVYVFMCHRRYSVNIQLAKAYQV